MSDLCPDYTHSPPQNVNFWWRTEALDLSLDPPAPTLEGLLVRYVSLTARTSWTPVFLKFMEVIKVISPFCGFLVTFSLGLKARVDPLASSPVCNGFLRLKPCATPGERVLASMTAKLLLPTYFFKYWWKSNYPNWGNNSLADPGFPRRGRQPQGGGANLLFGQIFAENCMKTKEIGSRGCTSLTPPWIRQCNCCRSN